VIIATEDKVKVLDFGLAKALADETQSVDSSQSPTLTEAMTRPWLTGTLTGFFVFEMLFMKAGQRPQFYPTILKAKPCLFLFPFWLFLA
jgi:hypothetical protein